MAKVFLSAGHGGSDPGATGFGMKEKDINLIILKACKEELIKNGVYVVCSRLKDENDPVNEEVKEANNSKADVAVSFHTNAGGGDGSETFYYANSSKGKRLAELCEKYTKEIGQNSRGVKSTNKLCFVSRTNMPAVLCECAFIDNANDKTIIDTEEEQKKFGIAYSKAILEYLGIKAKETNTIVEEPKKEEPKKEEISNENSKEFKVKIEISNLNIRKGPGTNYDKTGKVTGIGAFTIVEKKSGSGSKTGWGKLKSGLGWISLDYVKIV